MRRYKFVVAYSLALPMALFEVCEDDVVSCLKGQAVYLPKFGPKPMGMASDD